ncbi:TetR-like C-terminal domain-containing protein [Enterococcus canintestini]|uniref:TetR/AcrR family transcriptional regulator n=1 Tax=Enterococcus canintestini TaxID=317010 RepID=UPI00288E8419|nr:TetR-like C-terminal domain-containing protein [Enterococcus canintestini]MDT2739657.1 TetR-like C-terminal domain-containing protein [Enterococcus canintestini]
MNQADRRVRRTKKVLQESLAVLFNEKKLENITIRELTDYADVHRSTFYAHYEDIYALYTEIEDSVIEQLNQLINENFTVDLTQYYQLLFTYVDRNQKFCKMLFSDHAPATFLARLTVLFQSACFKSWQVILQTEYISEELLYLADYQVQGSFMLVRRWSKSDFSFSKEKLIAMIATIDEEISNQLVKKKFSNRLNL